MTVQVCQKHDMGPALSRCAGFIAALGFDVTVMAGSLEGQKNSEPRRCGLVSEDGRDGWAKVRSILLRGFDQVWIPFGRSFQIPIKIDKIRQVMD